MQSNIAPQAQALLKKMNAQTGGTPPPMSPAEQIAAGRQGYRATIPLAGIPEPIFRVTDQTIPGPAGNIPVRVYHPADEAGQPVLVYFHGGGFVAGDLDTHDAPLRAVANRSGCVVVSVAYRLAPEHPFPAAPEDCYAATQWVAGHAAEIGADADRLAVGGDSAGGDMAAVVCLIARDRGGPVIRYQTLLYPDTNLLEDTPSWQEFAETNKPVITRAGKLVNIALYCPDEADRINAYASPFYAAELRNLPPALIVTGECDPQRDEGEAYAARLEAAGNTVALTRYPGMIHGFFGFAGALDASRQLIEQTASALKNAMLDEAS